MPTFVQAPLLLKDLNTACSAFFLYTVCVPDVRSCVNRENGFYPYADDCGAFIRCLEGYYFNYTCPAGTKFNPAVELCDYPSDTFTCAVTVTLPPSVRTTLPTTASKCEGNLFYFNNNNNNNNNNEKSIFSIAPIKHKRCSWGFTH